MTCNTASFLPLPNSYWSCGIAGRIATTQNQIDSFCSSWTVNVCVCVRLRQLCACLPVWIVFMFVCVCMRACLCVRAYHHNIQLRHSTNIFYNCLRSNTIKMLYGSPITKTDSDEEMCALRCIILCLAAVHIRMLLYLCKIHSERPTQHDSFRQCIGCDRISE